jgi:hypothetical protein
VDRYLELKVQAARAVVETDLTPLWPEVLAPQIRAVAAVAAVILERMLTDTLVALALLFFPSQRYITLAQQLARPPSPHRAATPSSNSPLVGATQHEHGR